MDKKGKRDPPRTESSILFPSNYSFASWSTMTTMTENSMFTPVAITSAEPPAALSTTRSPESEDRAVLSDADLMTISNAGAQATSVQHPYSPFVQLRDLPPNFELPVPHNFFASSIAEENNIPVARSEKTAQLLGRIKATNLGSDLSSFHYPQYHYDQFSAMPTNPSSAPIVHSPSIEGTYPSSMSAPMKEATYALPETFMYIPVEAHWFYSEIIENRELWFGFSTSDSSAVEEAHQRGMMPQALLEQPQVEDFVPVQGGRYDVLVKQRSRQAVYWSEPINPVRRCTWFYKSDPLQLFVPYKEDTACKIEEFYERCCVSGIWYQSLYLDDGVVIVMEDPRVIMHYDQCFDVWSKISDAKISPRMVVRGVPSDSVVLPNEVPQIDHLVFVVQGIGSVCDLRFRTVSQCVDGFREISNRMIPSHFPNDIGGPNVGRVEFLPLAWHTTLHTNNVDLDRRLKSITLPSIPKLRYFTNDTLLDILLYSSPIYCQTIINTVALGLNDLYSTFITRNPNFSGKVSVAGHSLGSLILFDILTNQAPVDGKQEISDSFGGLQNVCLSSFQNDSTNQVTDESLSDEQELTFEVDNSLIAAFESLGVEDYTSKFLAAKIDLDELMLFGEEELKAFGLPKGPRDKVKTFIAMKKYENKLAAENEQAQNIRIMESYSIPAIETSDSLSTTYPSSLAEAISSLTFPKLQFNPSCFFALGSPISMFLVVRGYTTINKTFCFPTCPSFFHIFHPYDPVAFRIEPLIEPNFDAKPVLIPHHKGRKRMHIEIRENIAKVGSELKQKVMETLKYTWEHLNVFSKTVEAEVDNFVRDQIAPESVVDDSQAHGSDTDSDYTQIGALNGGRRIDYVLQEKPIEALNEYIFALTSHATYWDSEDTVLMILKEIYALLGVEATTPISSGSSLVDVSHSPKPSTSVPFSYAGSFMDNPPMFQVTSKTPELPMQSQFLDITHTIPSANRISSEAASNIPPHVPSQSIGPPPLSGFVRKYPFAKP